MKKNAFWNTISGILDAGQSAIILIFISRFLPINEAGVFSISYALANIVFMIARYGVRNYQVTDNKAEEKFRNYLFLRFVTIFISVLFIGTYLFFMYMRHQYDMHKVIIVFVMACYKMVDAFEDVFLGLYQQKGRLDIAGKVFAARVFSSTIVLCGAIVITKDLVISVVAAFLSGVLMEIILLRKTYPSFHISSEKLCKEEFFFLFKQCFPLCIGAVLAVYVSNLPKYMIDWYLNEKIQAIFGYLMMPAFCITLLSRFIFQPYIKQIGDQWNNKEFSQLKKFTLILTGIISVITLTVIVGGLLIGLPILSWLYHTDLMGYSMELFYLFLGTGLYTISCFFVVILTAMRKQNLIAAGYIAASITAFFISPYLAAKYGMRGACGLYIIINLFLSLLFFIPLWKNLCGTEAKKEGMNL